MQAVETDRVRVDDYTWRVTCANEDCRRGPGRTRKVFEARRSDASYCCGACRKYVFDAPKRKQNAMLELRLMARRAQEIATDYRFSQDLYDEMTGLQKAIKSAVNTFETRWEQTDFSGAPTAPSTAAAAKGTKSRTGRQPK